MRRPFQIQWERDLIFCMCISKSRLCNFFQRNCMIENMTEKKNNLVASYSVMFFLNRQCRHYKVLKYLNTDSKQKLLFILRNFYTFC